VAGLAYTLCVSTALACAVLLSRAYRATRSRLLFWSALCFGGLTITNGLALIDVAIGPAVDLYAARLATGLLSIGVLVYGMIWESR
jgi:hypothetical protein